MPAALRVGKGCRCRPGRAAPRPALRAKRRLTSTVQILCQETPARGREEEGAALPVALLLRWRCTAYLGPARRTRPQPRVPTPGRVPSLPQGPYPRKGPFPTLGSLPHPSQDSHALALPSPAAVKIRCSATTGPEVLGDVR